MYALFIDNQLTTKSNSLNTLFEMVLPNHETAEIRTIGGTPLYIREDDEWFDLRF